MGLAKVEIRETTVLKDYKDTDIKRWKNEVFAYENLSFATPKLLWYSEYWIEVERHIPILDLPKEQALFHMSELYSLIKKVNESGYWHCDIALCNVVVHPTRGALIIDWENLRKSESVISYDIYGHELAGVKPSWGKNSVYWNRNDSDIYPKGFIEKHGGF